jgi:hypothetical protein
MIELLIFLLRLLLVPFQSKRNHRKLAVLSEYFAFTALVGNLPDGLVDAVCGRQVSCD